MNLLGFAAALAAALLSTTQLAAGSVTTAQQNNWERVAGFTGWIRYVENGSSTEGHVEMQSDAKMFARFKVTLSSEVYGRNHQGWTRYYAGTSDYEGAIDSHAARNVQTVISATADFLGRLGLVGIGSEIVTIL